MGAEAQAGAIGRPAAPPSADIHAPGDETQCFSKGTGFSTTRGTNPAIQRPMFKLPALPAPLFETVAFVLMIVLLSKQGG